MFLQLGLCEVPPCIRMLFCVFQIFKVNIRKRNFYIARLSHREIRIPNDYMKIFNLSSTNEKWEECSVTWKCLFHIFKWKKSKNMYTVIPIWLKLYVYQNVDSALVTFLTIPGPQGPVIVFHIQLPLSLNLGLFSPHDSLGHTHIFESLLLDSSWTLL